MVAAARVTLLVGLALLVILQFLPWAKGPTQGSDESLFQTRDSASTWFSTLQGKADNETYESRSTWFAASDNDGIGALRVGLMALIGAMVLGGFALFLQLRNVRPADGLLIAACGVAVGIAVVCYVVGLRAFLGDGMTWSVAPFVAAVAAIVLLAAAVLTMIKPIDAAR